MPYAVVSLKDFIRLQEEVSAKESQQNNFCFCLCTILTLLFILFILSFYTISSYLIGDPCIRPHLEDSTNHQFVPPALIDVFLSLPLTVVNFTESNDGLLKVSIRYLYTRSKPDVEVSFDAKNGQLSLQRSVSFWERTLFCSRVYVTVSVPFYEFDETIERVVSRTNVRYAYLYLDYPSTSFFKSHLSFDKFFNVSLLSIDVAGTNIYSDDLHFKSLFIHSTQGDVLIRNLHAIDHLNDVAHITSTGPVTIQNLHSGSLAVVVKSADPAYVATRQQSWHGWTGKFYLRSDVECDFDEESTFISVDHKPPPDFNVSGSFRFYPGPHPFVKISSKERVYLRSSTV
ncbi:hypothetical protein RCL1_005983 [Eukaryota sp. TZLM3-RCL]